jgi:hypothetical protein
MKCILLATGKQLLDEIHAGQCGIHAASRTLVGKVFRSGFYWPTAKNDAAELVQRLPILIKTAASTSTATANHTRNMAICVLGTGHDWTIQESSRRIHSLAGCH